MKKERVLTILLFIILLIQIAIVIKLVAFTTAVPTYTYEQYKEEVAYEK